MCGIAGFEPLDARDHERAAVLLDALRARGPDSSWTRHGRDAVLVQTRLAVVDLSDRVTYPIANESETVWLVFNGEIYDHELLRRDLERRGHRFRTDCDAEVVVHAYEEWGVDAFGRLNGIFALALTDETTAQTLLVRDRFGVKPLVHTTRGRFAWSSDAIGLVSSGLAPGGIDVAGIEQFAAFHYIPEAGTGIQGINELAPGSVLVRDRDGTSRSFRFASPLGEPRHQEATEAAERTGDALGGAVARQLAADVPVGVLLSGGVDSALMLALAVDAGASPRAFTLAFPEFGAYDESLDAARVAAACGVPHEVEAFDSTFAASLGGVQQAFDQPFADPSSIATVELARLARSSVKVVLSGSGGDELFAGYYRLRAHRIPLPRPLPQLIIKAIGPVARGSERSTAGRLMRSYGHRLATAAGDDPVTQYFSLVGSSTSEAGLRRLRAPVDTHVVRARYAEEPRAGAEPHRTTLRRLLAYETGLYLPGDILMKEDRATMSVGLEARVPFLDEDVARVAATLPDETLVSIFRGKKVLRDVARDRAPGLAQRQGKRGFAVPLDALLAGPWRQEASEWFAGTPSELVDTTQVAVDIQRGSGLVALDTWALASLVAWEERLQRATAVAVRG